MMTIIQTVLWAATFILIAVSTVKTKEIAMPPLAVAFNFAWQTAAIIRDVLVPGSDNGFIFHIIWYVFDIVILLVFFIKTKASDLLKYIVAVLSVSVTACMYLVFDNIENGMLIMGFVTELTMAGLWLCHKPFTTDKTDKLIITIAFTKLFGDLFAWIANAAVHPFVNIAGALVLAVNIAYICMVFSAAKKIKKTSHKKAAIKNKKK